VRGRLLLARGERQAAEEVLIAGSRHALRNGIERLTHAVEWERVRIALTEGDVPRARVLARSLAPHPPADVPPALIELYDEVNGAGIETIRLHLHDGDPQSALRWVDAHIEHAAGTLRRRRLMKLRILQALALRALGQDEAAVDSMAAAVRLAASMGAVRSFGEEGAGAQTLLSALASRPGAWADEKTGSHLRILLSTFDAGAAEPAIAQAAPTAVGDDMLSKREAQILQRLSQGYSNLAVAQQLFVSTHTVKWHLRQIYDKLGARNRSQAIFRARELGLLQ
jgi:LuxR family transcriptional regulator, maltose regulon positive regulatory protein